MMHYAMPIPPGVDLQKDARPQDQFELWHDPTLMVVNGSPYIHQTVKWYANKADHEADRPYFEVHIVGWFTRWYTGQAKIDGTRTNMFWHGQLGGRPIDLDRRLYVVNRWAEEMWSVRFTGKKLDCYRPDNQGGI